MYLFYFIFVEAKKGKDLQHFWAESFKSSFFLKKNHCSLSLGEIVNLNSETLI
jgi:hypothetical protein